MAAAAAKDAIHCSPDLRVIWLRNLIEQQFGSHDHAVHAISALRRLLLDECPLQFVRIGNCAEPFESCDVTILYRTYGNATRANGLALDNYRARPTL